MPRVTDLNINFLLTSVRREFLGCLLALVAVVGAGFTQATSPTSREATVQKVKAFADRHVQAKAPMQTHAVLEAFATDTTLDKEEIAATYEKEYLRLKALEKPSITEELGVKLPWFLTIVLALALLVGNAAKGWLTDLLKRCFDGAYSAVAGMRVVRRFSLRRYRKALADKYRLLRVPFRPNRPLDMAKVYVPLKVADSNSSDLLDANLAITKYRRIVVVGTPGSGKSMLLKRLALNYANGEWPILSERPIPIVLELHRMNDPTLSIEQHLVAELARNDFPHAEHFISVGLQSDMILPLLDGLDEVNGTERRRVVGEVTDFLDRHRGCRVVITCRSAVYREEFAEHTDQKLEIVEFNDQQIRQFLRSWEADMPVNRSPEALVATLQDRPRIMALARNPLLLTIIACLYTDAQYNLPHSRAEFYRQSTDFLLGQLHPEANRFEPRAKRLVLQHLALFNQDNSSQQYQDRRSIAYTVVLQELRKVLPDLNLKPEEQSEPLLKEIVERSGLLLAVDGGQNYQFAHLTLQEYFAAAKLINDPSGLIRRFRSPGGDAWREVVKLWCGLDIDSTDLVADIYSTDSVMALECLADSQKVTPQLAADIVETNKGKLSDAVSGGAVQRAFAAIASDVRPRGSELFKFLEERLHGDDEPARIAAANALSMTNLPSAARVLAQLEYDHPSQVRTQLFHMGDLAVPALKGLVPNIEKLARPHILDDLQLIGSPGSAVALTSLLWDREESVSIGAAWRLGALVSLPGVQEELRNYSLPDSPEGKELSWLWEPFNEPPDSSVPQIAGRILELIDRSSLESLPSKPVVLDPRLSVPIGVIMHRSDLGKTLRSEEVGSSSAHRFAERILTNKLVDPGLGFALRCTEATLLSRMLRVIGKDKDISKADWLNVFHPLSYQFETGWHFRAIYMLLFLASTVAPLIIGIQVSMRHGVWRLLWSVPLLIVVFIGWRLFLESRGGIERTAQHFCKFFIFGVYQVPPLFVKMIRRFDFGAPDFGMLVFFIWMPSELILVGSAVSHWTTAKFGLLASAVLLVNCVGLWAFGQDRERKAGNPLFGILDGMNIPRGESIIRFPGKRHGRKLRARPAAKVS